jgi:hypothetical protein
MARNASAPAIGRVQRRCLDPLLAHPDLMLGGVVVG